MREIHNMRCFSLSSGHQLLPWPEKRTRIFASGREALIALIKALDLTSNDRVLLPAYVPEGVYAPFVRSGIRVCLYPLDRYLDPEWDQLSALMANLTPKMAVLIHYFGLTKPIQRFCEICHQHKVLVIEDLAHILPLNESPLGKMGDFVLFSLPKLIGIPDGAPLVAQTPDFDMDRLNFEWHPLHTVYVLQQLIGIAANTFSRVLPVWRVGNISRRLIHKLPQSYTTLMRYFKTPNHLSGLSSFLLGHADLEAAARRRRTYASLYASQLDHAAFERFPGCESENHGAFGFPVLIRDRERFMQFLSKHGIEGNVLESRWDFIPETDRSAHLKTIETMRRHFLFPTSHYLKTNEIEYVIGIANQWALEAGH
jgi:dTDP-4-amino-4,6-dideoxygalactose transaminase